MSNRWGWIALTLLSAGAIVGAFSWAASFRAKQVTFGNRTEAYPVVSPDGRWLAYEQLQDEGPELTQIWIQSMHQGFPSARRLTPIGMWSSAPSWSSDSNWISFVGDTHATDRAVRVVGRQVYRLDVYTNELVQLTHLDDGGVGPHACWSRSGWIAFERDGDIFAVKDDGSAVARLFSLRSFNPDMDMQYLSWSPDSKQIAFSAETRSPSGELRSSMWVGDVASGQIRQVSFASPDYTDYGPDWLDNDTLVFTRATKSAMKVSASLLDLRTGKVITVTSGYVDWLPHMTPDRNSVVFSRVKNLADRDDWNFLYGSHIFEKRLSRNRLEAEIFKRF